jgi:CHRD domain
MRWWWLFALLACGLLGLIACGPASDCPEGLHPFKNGCATSLTINFMTCVEERGRSLEENRRARLEAAVDTAFKVTGGEGMVDVAREVVETENTPVARDIIRYCLELTNKAQHVPQPQSGKAEALPSPTHTPIPTATLEPATFTPVPTDTPTPTPTPPTVVLEPTATPTQAPTLTPEDTPQLIRQFGAQLDGDQVIPSRTTNTTGEATFQLRDETYLDFTFNLVNVKNVVEADIRCAPAGEIGAVGVMLFDPVDSSGGAVESFVTEGTITEIDPTNGCGWGDMAAVVEAMQSGLAYVNVYGDFPGGEIRGQIEP